MAEGEAFNGTIEDENEQPVEGVAIEVATLDGEVIDTVTTDADGEWSVQVPEAGEYQLTLDEETLPDGVGLRDPELVERTAEVKQDRQRFILYPMGEPIEEPGWYERAPQLAYEGILFGLIIAMAALGLSLIFGTTGLTYFAHGEMVTLGALLAFFGNVAVGLPLLLAAPLAVIVAAGLGWCQDRFFWGVLRKRGTGLIAMLVISIGLAILLRYFYLFLFGGRGRNYTDFQSQAPINLFDETVSATPRSLWIIGISVVVIVGVGAGLLYTRIGKATRAVADNPALAASSGINVDRVIRTVWTVGAALAALAGIFLAVTQQVRWQMGMDILLLIFAGVILGGLGTAFGALLGGLIVGLFIQLSTLWVPAELKNVGALAILIVILLIRPQGILGRRERVG